MLATPSRHPGGAATRWLRGLDTPLPPAPRLLPAPAEPVHAGEPALL
ncbi:MAG TPA: hypothetical protein VGM21_20845 [Actinomycetota bacterium]